MKKPFHRGLVVGKFAPLHRGHELVIHHAFEQCDEVILISYSKPELPGCSPEVREQWLAALFPNAVRLVVTHARLQEWKKLEADPGQIPHNDADEKIHREFCAYLCRSVLKKEIDVIFTSESYGNGFAEELTRYFRRHNPAAAEVRHIIVDHHRKQIPVSGTHLRENVHQNRQWLSPAVYASFVKRICFLGGESSGKSTLAGTLGRHFGTMHVPEYGRELWDKKKGNFVFEDMLLIAQTQVKLEEEAALKANEFLFCDTSPLTTLFYSNHRFGQADAIVEHLAKRLYHFVILCAPDFPFVQDGTRRPESFRQLQHEWYLQQLASRKINYLLVTGSIENRVRQIQEFIQAKPR
ncbi:MAG TPA: AAA family ATPase [Pseudomonadales bacterium]|nr:AAA family ATPase [Pseudomonadales bacterium]